MVSFARVLDEDEDERRRRRSLGSVFTASRGETYDFSSAKAQEQTEEQQSAQTAGNLDTLDLTPTPREQLVIQEIENALAIGDTTYAADMLKYALQVPELDFTPHMDVLEELADAIEAALPPDQKPSFADTLDPSSPTPSGPRHWLEEYKRNEYKPKPGEDTPEGDVFLNQTIGTVAIPVFGLFG